MKPKRCKQCKETFTPARSMQSCCSPLCAHSWVNAAKERKAEKERKEEGREDRKRREAMKTISQLESECRVIAQKIARLRDRNDGCISCHMGANYSGQWHGSHYRAHGACSSLQLHLWNIHKACAQCNLFKGGNKEGYILGLLAKPGYGRERLEWLDSQPKSIRFSRDYLGRYKEVMSKRMRRLSKRS